MADKSSRNTKNTDKTAQAPANSPNANGKSRTSNDFEHVMSSLMNGAGGVISSKTVMGEPVVVGDTTLIPLSDVTIGAGAGSNNGTDKNAGMGGFTAKMSPSAVLVLKNGVTKVVNVRNQDAVTKLVDLIPEVVDRILEQPTIRSMMGNEEAVEKAFPSEQKGGSASAKEEENAESEGSGSAEGESFRA